MQSVHCANAIAAWRAVVVASLRLTEDTWGAWCMLVCGFQGTDRLNRTHPAFMFEPHYPADEKCLCVFSHNGLNETTTCTASLGCTEEYSAVHVQVKGFRIPDHSLSSTKNEVLRSTGCGSDPIHRRGNVESTPANHT